ncbi:MAG: orotate phosphoribosyltransferase [Methanosarcinales archaeon]|nr:orotate phosphoribosyltransferase [Methanosarcinales archaeon]
MDDRDRMLSLLQNKALEVRKVTLSSGKESNYYIDAKRVILTAEGAYLTGKLLLEKLDPRVKAVAGMTLGADPIVAAISVMSHIQKRDVAALIVRKEPKKHGTMRFIEGPRLEKGDRVAVVDDVVTTGASLVKSIERIEDEGYQVVQALAILDRMEGGHEELLKAGYRLDALFTRDDLEIKAERD